MTTPQKPTYTHAQYSRQQDGLPFEGAQPAVMFTRFVEKGKLRHRPEYSEYFILDGRHSPYSHETLLGVCVAHTAKILFAQPDLVAMVHTYNAIDPADRRSGGMNGPLTISELTPKNIKHYADEHVTPTIAALALTLRGAETPHEPVNPFAGADFSAATALVSTRFRSMRQDQAMRLTSL